MTNFVDTSHQPKGFKAGSGATLIGVPKLGLTPYFAIN